VKSLFAALAVAFVGIAAADDKPDPKQPAQSRPAPKWLRIVDQGDGDPRLKGYKTPEGIKVEIVAEAPVVVNPVGMTFGTEGTPYVVEWRPSPGDEGREQAETITYKDGSKRTIAIPKKRVKDVVKTLRDSQNKGVFDQSQIILEDELPSSILQHAGWLYVAGRGTVRRYKQSKPGGDYDVKEMVTQGFGGFGQQQVSGLTIGHDGWLYITSGAADNHAEGSDGSRATVLRSGAVFRCRTDGSKLHLFAIGLRNPYRDVACDALGNLFHVDGDGGDDCRLVHILDGSDFGWRLRQGSRSEPDRVRTELPGKVPPLLRTGRGVPTGLLIYDDTRLPEQYRGLLLRPDVERRRVQAYRVEKLGASFEVVEEFALLQSDDPLFRPCQAVTGPDGAIYVVDWRTDADWRGRLWGDGKNGRIYRLTWGGTTEQPAIARRDMDSWAKIAKLDDDELLKVLAGPDATDRSHAQREITRRGDKLRPALVKLLQDSDQSLVGRVAALGSLQGMWDETVQAAVERVLTGGNADLRRLAADALGRNVTPRDERAHALLLKELNDSNPAIRRAVALALSRVGAPGAADHLANAVANDDGKDVYLTDGLVRSVENLGKPGLERLIAVADSGVQKETDHVVEAWTAFRTRPAGELIPTVLGNPHLSDAQRANLLRSYCTYLLDPPLSLEPLADYLLEHPPEFAPVKLAGLEALLLGGALQTDKGKAWLETVLNEKGALRADALRLLLSDAAGAKLLGQRYREKKLPETDLPQLTKALRRHAASDTEAAKLLAEITKSDKPEQ
jgi:putative membrane-bound dehydrogenase-like protein